MPLQTIEQLTFLPSAGPHSWVFRCRMPPPLLRVQGCYTLQPGPRWGANAHLRLHPVHKRQALGLHQSLLGLGLACCSGEEHGPGYAVPFFFFGFFPYPITQLHSRILSTIRTTPLWPNSVSTQCPLNYSPILNQPLQFSPCTAHAS